jgi:heptosyltransferase-2/heptosyltransferase-3
VVNAAHDLGLRRLFALATLAHSCVSLDSGPAHVAAACGCPVVVLMGMADPRRNRPLERSGGVEIVTSVPQPQWPASRAEWEAWHRVAEIEVPAVIEAWERLDLSFSRKLV